MEHFIPLLIFDSLPSDFRAFQALATSYGRLTSLSGHGRCHVNTVIPSITTTCFVHQMPKTKNQHIFTQTSDGLFTKNDPPNENIEKMSRKWS